MSETDPEAPLVAIVWPYLVFAPLPFAVVAAAMGVGAANALGGVAVNNMLMGFFLTYLLLSVPVLVFGLFHRNLHRASGRHRLGPVLGLALGLSVLVTLPLLNLPNQQGAPTGQDIAMLFAIVAGGAMALALIGFAAVWLIDRWRRMGQA